MKIDRIIQCVDFPCLDTRRDSYLIPNIDIDPAKVSIMLISEASPLDPGDHYYAGPEALFARTTLLAFQDAGSQVQSVQELLDGGIYMTTAVKCGKIGYDICHRHHCSLLAPARTRDCLVPECHCLLADG